MRRLIALEFRGVTNDTRRKRKRTSGTRNARYCLFRRSIVSRATYVCTRLNRRRLKSRFRLSNRIVRAVPRRASVQIGPCRKVYQRSRRADAERVLSLVILFEDFIVVATAIHTRVHTQSRALESTSFSARRRAAGGGRRAAHPDRVIRGSGSSTELAPRSRVRDRSNV